jgi:lysophospholipase L1-like esterase
MKLPMLAVLSLSLVLGLAGANLPVRAQPPAAPNAKSSTTPTDRNNEAWWKARHEHVLESNKQAPPELLFIGDSITQGWEEAGKSAWTGHFAPRHAANFGFSGDRTQHVLWRLDHGEVDGIAPKAAVIMIGTNNSNGADNTADEIADGVKAIVARLHEKQPRMRVLLLGIFPRGEKPNPQREKIAAVNASIAKLDDGKMVRYLDIGPGFLQPDGSISKEIMPDFLHLSPKGYDIWTDAIDGKVQEMLAAGKEGR